jgi:hypothetical protein
MLRPGKPVGERQQAAAARAAPVLPLSAQSKRPGCCAAITSPGPPRRISIANPGKEEPSATAHKSIALALSKAVIVSGVTLVLGRRGVAH